MVFPASVIAAVAGATLGQASIYHGHHMVLVTASTPEQLAALDELGVNLACREGIGIQRMIVAPENLPALMALNLPTITVSENVEAIIESEAAEIRRLRDDRNAAFFTVYRRTPEISAFVDELITLAPTVVTRVSVGTSVQGRTIFGVKITGPGGGSKPKVVITGCQHAREWISPMTVCWAAEQLALGYGVDSEITALLNAVEVHIIPVVNPDGYEYSHDLDRYWRKNRKSNAGGTIGVDLNRNWAYQFGGAGSSGTENAENYRGIAAFSESETAGLSAYMTTLAGSVSCVGDCAAGNRCSGLRGHLDVHTFGALVLGPWSYSTSVVPPREEILRAVQNEMAGAIIGAHSYPYLAGLGLDNLLSAASGVATDWTFAQYGTLAWTYELRPDSGGVSSFDPPPSEIVPASEETFEGILSMLHRIATPSVGALWSNLPKTITTASSAEVRVASVFDECGSTPTGTLYRRSAGSGSFTPVGMVRTGTNFTATLNAGTCGSAIEYYVELQMAGFPTPARVPAAPGTYITATTRDATVVFTDTFQSNLGWTVTNSGSLTDGAWVRGVPVGPPPPGGPSTDGDGSGQCYVTDNSTSNSDVDGGSTTLTSPTLNASDANSYVEYARWYSNRMGTSPNLDTFLVQVSDDNGATWEPLETIGPGGPENNGGWIRRSYKISTIPNIVNSTQFKVRFVAEDADPASNVEAGVDGVRIVIYKCTPIPCVGDINGDLRTNVADFNILAFHFGQFVSQGTFGDLNRSGKVDVNDFNILASDFACIQQ